MWGFKKSGNQAIGRSRGGLTTKIHTLNASARVTINFSLSGGEKGDAPEGRKLLHFTGSSGKKKFLLIDKAYSGKKMRLTAIELGYEPVVPPKKNFKEQWAYNRELYKQRNEIERFFRRLKAFRRIFTRYDKLDVVFSGFILFAMIVDSLAVTNLLKGRVQLTSNVAMRLESVLVPAVFRENFEALYREDLIKVEEKNQIIAYAEIAKKLPYTKWLNMAGFTLQRLPTKKSALCENFLKCRRSV